MRVARQRTAAIGLVTKTAAVLGICRVGRGSRIGIFHAVIPVHGARSGRSTEGGVCNDSWVLQAGP
jgi:hypothetical protein